MSKFIKAQKKSIGVISTASLPDIVFMLLFFFMVTTVMREVELKVRLKIPTATEVKKLEDKSLVRYIYIGEPINSEESGNVPRIQFNDSYAGPEQIRERIAAEIGTIDGIERQKMTVSLKINSKTEMGLVTDVKQELRKANALKINYSAIEGDPIFSLAN